MSIFRVGSFPNINDYDYECKFPLDDDAVASLTSYMDVVNTRNDSSLPRSSFVTGEPDRWTCFFSGDTDANGYVF